MHVRQLREFVGGRCWEAAKYVPHDTCCVLRGDCDHDGKLNVADLTDFVDFVFFGSPAPPCMEEGDVEGNGVISISDLGYLVDYSFYNGPLPMPC